jgi:uncharacterized protein YndB with AHSA1/START domain
MRKDAIVSDGPVFNVTRVFKAPRELVWKAWTDPALFTQWFGPKGVTTTVLRFELEPGGIAHSRMDTPDGQRMWAKFVYREIEPPSRLVWEHSFADADANIIRGPFDDTWPLRLLATLLFTDEGADTRITLTWWPMDATDTERATFEATIPSMSMGWGGTFDRLDDFLPALRG